MYHFVHYDKQTLFSVLQHNKSIDHYLPTKQKQHYLPPRNNHESASFPLPIASKVFLLLQQRHNSSYIIIFPQITTLMRRRSGALHCESQLDFIQLAEAAHDHIGVFYDQRTNRKIMTHLHPPKRNTHKQHTTVNPESSAEKGSKQYRGFQFGMESEADRQERVQLSRANLEIARQVHVGIVGNDAVALVARVSGGGGRGQSRNFDLFVERYNNCLVKYWIIGRQHKSDSHLLRETYLKQCKLVIEERQGKAVVVRGRDQWGDLAGEIERRLNHH